MTEPVTPPSTKMFCPLMYAASSEARNNTTDATSLAVPNLPLGTFDKDLAKLQGAQRL